MKRFKVEGWYRYNDEKDFEQHYFFAENMGQAIEKFRCKYRYTSFYKIDVKELRLTEM